MMYISLGLFLLYFVSVHGVINKCYIGGINESNCDKINKGSVLQLYISSFGSKSPNNEPKSTNNGPKSNIKIDQPYIFYKHNDDVSLHFEYKSMDMEGILKNCSPISLLDLFVMENEKNLVEEWNTVLNHGTDMHRLKFHNKLVYMYSHNGFSSFTNEDTMIFIKSFYETANMYYLANFTKRAYNVTKDVMYLFTQTIENKLTDIDLKEFTVWKILCYTLKLKIIESIITQYTQENMMDPSIIDKITAVENDKINTENSLVEELNNMPTEIINNYPCPYILIYQSYLLDKDMDNEEKNNLTNILKNNLIDCSDYHSHANLYYMYKYLTTTIIELDSCTFDNNLNAFSNLMLALMRPVLCIEDRLLNYKATLLMMDLCKNCIEANTSNTALCEAIEIRRNDSIITKYILDKITQLITYDTKTQNIKSNLIEDDKINEDFVHMIVTMAIDMDSNSESYKKKINNVKSTIGILKEYVNLHCIKSLEHMDDSTTNKLNIAYKWLIELNAVLCDGFYNTFQIAYITNMSKFKDTIKTNRLAKNDSHRDYLLLKNHCKDVPKILSSKNYYKIGGWIFAVHKEKTTFTKETIKFCTKKYSDFILLTNPFINYTDAYIQLSRYYFETDFSKASMYIQKALRMPVISPEDRYRNLEAHELYSMYFMIQNSKDSKEMKKLKNK